MNERLLNRSLWALISVMIILTSCRQSSENSQIQRTAEQQTYIKSTPDWAKNLAIYEVNIRQYTPEGTFKAFEDKMEALRDMGVGILWLMPIHPIGELNRKGSLGSYYSVKDYKGVNPDFGNLEDLKSLVKKAHSMGMYVIIDWVANHTAWDNPLTELHPEWYTKDSLGQFVPPVADWSDVIDLNFGEAALWDYQLEALSYWVKEADIDGFRCDVADMVPLEFWNKAREELDKIKPVFMLAEAETPALHEKAFDMTYGWNMHHKMNEIAQGKKSPAVIDTVLLGDKSKFRSGNYRMYFTSNHDENSWNGTVGERMGNAAEVFAVLSATLPGMPLIYSGQEAGLDKRLKFFEKDEIEWKESPYRKLYTRLLQLKEEHTSLWNGDDGGSMKVIPTEHEGLYCFARTRDDCRILVLLNLSDKDLTSELQTKEFQGSYIDISMDREVSVGENYTLSLPAWGYQLLAR